MTLEVDARSVPDSATTTRPWVRWTAGLALVALVATVGSGALWAWRYQPLDSGMRMAVEANEAAAVERRLGEARVVRPAPGSDVTFTFGLMVPPDAPAAVTIETVVDPFSTSGELTGVVERTLVTVTGLEPSSLDVPASVPVELQPGQLVDVTVTATLAECAATEGSRSVDTIPVTYSAFGLRHTVDVPLGYTLTLVEPPTCAATV